MNRALSLYLDLARFTAAMVVFIGHISGQRLTGGLFWQVAPYMSHAVTVFFVLSGFVIAYATDRGEDTAVSYGVSRASRIYSVALPALFVTFLLDRIGQDFRPEFYTSAWGYESAGQWFSFPICAVFLNEIWFFHISPGSDLPYWSLGYEVWYYIIFGVFLFSRRKWLMISAILLLVGPKIVSMLPIWLFGVTAYRLSIRWGAHRILGCALWGASLLLWIAYEIWAHHHGRWLAHQFELLRRDELPQDYLVGFLFAVGLVGFHAAAEVFSPILQPFARPIRWTAGATFTLYLFHLPIAQFLTTILPWPPATPLGRVAMLGSTLALVFVTASLTERRKDMWRHGFTRLIHVIANRTGARDIVPGGVEGGGAPLP